MKKAETYQVGVGPSNPAWTDEWTEGTFYVGVLEAYNATHDSQYWTDATAWATKNRYAITVSATAPDYNSWCPGQVYADLYLLNPAANASDTTSSEASFAAVDTTPLPSFGDTWWWADALFMAPGLVARLGSAAGAGDTKYSTFLDTEWMATQNALYDPARKLFWRDSTFVSSDTYWSRGNGWVMAGAVRVLEYLPETDPLYAPLTTLLMNMAGAVVPLQGPDGLWRSNLLDAGEFPNPETSGTGLMTFAIAWGINHGILDGATYLPAVMQAWNGLVANVSPAGMLEYVQPTGSGPAAATATDTNDYGVGAFLLAGSQVANLP
ncbi:MAG: glycoside hydrolase family 88 protein [Polyangiaceae bacterium]|jgi:rhamnogalacturonyl hydrolase YesR